VKQEGGIWYLDINADAGGKSVKNSGTVRKVPLHRALIREGLLKYVKGLDPRGPLFPDLKVDRFGQRGTNFSKVYGRWQRKLGITDPKKVAHSWRHRFTDLCRGAGIEKAIHDALTGHSSSDEGDKYGLGYPLATLAKAVAKLPS
jgi:integrase